MAQVPPPTGEVNIQLLEIKDMAKAEGGKPQEATEGAMTLGGMANRGGTMAPIRAVVAVTGGNAMGTKEDIPTNRAMVGDKVAEDTRVPSNPTYGIGKQTSTTNVTQGSEK